jgi:hypothetical protein
LLGITIMYIVQKSTNQTNSNDIQSTNINATLSPNCATLNTLFTIDMKSVGFFKWMVDKLYKMTLTTIIIYIGTRKCSCT